MNRSPMGWFRDLSIGQKFLLSFGFILALLVLSLTALSLYLAPVNTYVHWHNRITVPAALFTWRFDGEALLVKRPNPYEIPTTRDGFHC